MKRSQRGNSSVTRRKLLLATGGGLITLGGLAETDAFQSFVTDRSSSVDVGSDDAGLLGIDELQSSKVYQSPHPVEITNQTGEAISNASVTSRNTHFRFRNVGSTDNSITLSLGAFSTQQTKTFEIVTAPSQTGEVTDDVIISADSSVSSLSINRETTINFKSGGVLVYAINGSIEAYDSANDTLSTPPTTNDADIIGGNVADIVAGSSADIPYISQNSSDVFATWIGASGDQALGKPSSPGLKKQKTRLSVGKWQPSSLSGNIILAADSDTSKIIGIDSNGTTDTIADLSNGCGGVAGVEDIDADGNDEIVFIDSSQQLRYLTQNGSVSKIPNGTVGSNNSAGFGLPADFGNGIVVPHIDGSQNPAVIDYNGDKTILNSSGVAKKAAVAPVDIDADGTLEFTFLGNANGKIKYIDDVYGTNAVKTFRHNGGPVTPDESVGLNSGADN
jgi:hypothetical protein